MVAARCRARVQRRLAADRRGRQDQRARTDRPDRRQLGRAPAGDRLQDRQASREPICWATTAAPPCSCRSTCMRWAPLPSDTRGWPTPRRRCITSPTAGISRVDTIQGADFVRSTSERPDAATEADQLASTLRTINDGVRERPLLPLRRRQSQDAATTAPTATSAPPAAPMSTSGSPTRSASIWTRSRRSS